MAKRTPSQSRQSSTIHLVQENGMPTILNRDHAGDQTRRSFQRFREENSPTEAQPLDRASPSRTGRDATLSMEYPAQVLKELFELLEDYAPVWYTEESHNRAKAALARTMG